MPRATETDGSALDNDFAASAALPARGPGLPYLSGMSETPSPYEPFPAGNDEQRQFAKPPAPGTITAAAACYLVATVVAVVSAILTLSLKDDIADSLRNTNTGNLTDTQIDQAAQIAVIIAMVVSLIFALVYLWLALKLRAGRNWARITLTVLTVLQLLSLLTNRAGGTSWISYLSIAAAVVGLVLAYLPQSSEYINSVKRSRA